MGKKTKDTKKKTKKTQVLAEENVPTREGPLPVAKWEIVPDDATGENMLVLYDETDFPMTYILLTDVYAGEMTKAMNRNLGLVSDVPDEWSLIVPEDRSYTPTLNFFSAGVTTASVELTPEVLEEMNPKLLKLYNPNAKQPSRFLPWMGNHPVKTTLLIVMLAGFLGYGTLTYFL